VRPQREPEAAAQVGAVRRRRSSAAAR
jgi:hypothetical protein